ncbi:integral membrane protein, partial [Penicillium cosmopolitanum]
TRYGYGHHIDTIHDELIAQLDFVSELAYVVAICAIKASFCLFYLKIFPGKLFRILCCCVLAVIVGESIAGFFIVIFQCWPVARAWDAAGAQEGHCLDLLTFYYVSFAVRLVTDVALITLPVPKLLRLKTSIGKKAGLMVMFGLGGLVTVASIIRGTYLSNFSTDHTWSLVQTLNWSSAELGVGVFISCVPSFKALVTFQFPNLRSLLGLSSNQSYLPNHETYNLSDRRETPREASRSWRQSHVEIAHSSKLVCAKRAKRETGTTQNDSKEDISSQPSDEIRVTTNVTVDRTEDSPSRPS